MLPPLIQIENACAAMAFSASVAANIEDVLITAGVTNEVKSAPLIICIGRQFEQVIHGAAIWNIRTDIVTKEIAADTEDFNNGVLSGLMYATFVNSSSIDTLNNIASNSNFGVYDITAVGGANSQEGDAWVQTLSLDIVCAGPTN